jgi:hypothetical protein
MGFFRNVWKLVKNCCPKKTYYYCYSDYSGFFESNMSSEDDSSSFMGAGSFISNVNFDNPEVVIEIKYFDDY